jgi:hypothetical protein
VLCSQALHEDGAACHLPQTAAGAGINAAPAPVHVLPCHSTAGMRQQQLAGDPYIEWWSLSLQLDAAESRAHDHLSSLSYMPVMLQVRPASSCSKAECTDACPQHCPAYKQVITSNY